MRTFKGRAGIIRRLQGSIDMINMYKTDPKLEALLLKEREKDYGWGVVEEEKKYREADARK